MQPLSPDSIRGGAEKRELQISEVPRDPSCAGLENGGTRRHVGRENSAWGGSGALIEPAFVSTELLFALLGMIAVVGFFAFRRREERRALLLIAIAAYALKAILVPAYYWLLVETGAGGFAYFDSAGYHEAASEVALEIAHGLPRESAAWRTKDPGYSVICGVLYAIFGSSTLIARFFNSVASTFTLLYVYRIACISFDAGVARVAVWLAAFLPFSILITINHQKEAVVVFVATLLFYHALRIVTQQRGWASSVPILAIWLVPMSLLRGGFVLPFLGLFLIMFFLTQRSILEGGLVSVLVVLALVTAQLLAPESLQLDVQENVVELDKRLESVERQVRYTGGLLRYVKPTTPLDIWKVPIAAFLLILLPFPPELEGQQVYGYIRNWSHLAFIALLPQFLLGLREVFRADDWKRRLPLFIYAGGFLALIGALAIGVLRYRETVFPAILVITAAGVKARQNFLWSASIYAGLLLFATFVYFNRHVL